MEAFLVRLRLASFVLVAAGLPQCSVPERDNPLDPAAHSGAGGGSSLVLQVPLPKELAGVVHRVVATLQAPDQPPITRELAVSPLGPATGTMSVLAPGSGRTLTLSGYDVEGNLLFTGQQTGITISARHTTHVEITLELVAQPPADTSGVATPGVTPADSAQTGTPGGSPADTTGSGGESPPG
ncbi:MAG: hypothetical protein AB1505_08825 [Candidatus Latescibacterota bacterium]